MSTRIDIASKELRLTRRGQLALALLAGAVTVGAVFGVKSIEHVISGAESNLQQGVEFSSYDHPFASESGLFSRQTVIRGADEEGLKPGSYKVVKVSPDDPNPTELAIRLGAEDPGLVSEEIAGQVGGEGSLHAGQYALIPEDQLATSKK